MTFMQNFALFVAIDETFSASLSDLKNITECFQIQTEEPPNIPKDVRVFSSFFFFLLSSQLYVKFLYYH